MGPAGLAAASSSDGARRVLLCDAGRPRNAASKALHGFLTRDGIRPGELLRIGRRELAKYGIELVRGEARDARRTTAGFEVVLAGGRRLSARTLLVATGVVDQLPDVEGVRALYGRGVFHCPYCDGWEVSDRPLAVYGRGRSGMALALALLTWSHDVALLSDGSARLPLDGRRRLAAHGVDLVERKIAKLERSGKGSTFVFGRQRLARALSLLEGRSACDFRAAGLPFHVERSGEDEPLGRPSGRSLRRWRGLRVQFEVVAAAEGQAG